MSTYNPSLFTLTQKSLGVSKAIPDDARSWYYDDVNFFPRPYRNLAEALAYLNTSTYRSGHFPVVINTGGTIDVAGKKMVGGVNTEYWFRNGTADSNLVQKYKDISDSDIAAWNTTPTLQQVLSTTNGNDSGLPIKVSSVFIKGPIVTNMTELDTVATTATRKITFPDASGTMPLTVAGVAANATTGDIPLTNYYTKAQTDAAIGSGGGGGVAGVSSFNSRTGAVLPVAGDYTLAMVGGDQLNNTSDANKPLSTLAAAAINGKVDKINGKSLIADTEITRLSTVTAETGATIKSKLGVTVLSGSNTGDQDINGKVDKINGKSLISDSEITRLATVQNINLLQGNNITLTGTYPNITVSSSGGNGGGVSPISAGAGVNSVNVPAGRFITAIVFKGPTPNTVKAGFSAGGSDIVAPTLMNTRQPVTVFDVFDADTIIYFTKAADTTAIIY